ncbi:uncharacterized protein LOC135102339 isoform X2 [Scylla paramamosain]
MKFAATYVLAVVVAVSGVVEKTSFRFKQYPGHYLQGDVAIILKGVTLVQCTAACGPLRVFNLQGSWPAYTCYILSSFTTFIKSQFHSVYYDTGMYKENGFYQEFGRSVFTPSSSSPKVSWLDAYWICRGMWAAFFVPQTQSEWEWMKQVAADSNYGGMWIGVQEMVEDSNSYMWLGVTVMLAPDPVNLTLEDDSVTYQMKNDSGTWVTDDPFDCGVLLPREGEQFVLIEDCYDVLHEGYMCEAIFPPLGPAHWTREP